MISIANTRFWKRWIALFLKSETGNYQDNMEIIYRGNDIHYRRPQIGNRYIIHKPQNTDEIPTWVWGMDKLDGESIVVVEELSDGENKIDGLSWWARKVADGKPYPCLLNLSWLEIIEDYEELQDREFEIVDLF